MSVAKNTHIEVTTAELDSTAYVRLAIAGTDVHVASDEARRLADALNKAGFEAGIANVRELAAEFISGVSDLRQLYIEDAITFAKEHDANPFHLMAALEPYLVPHAA